MTRKIIATGIDLATTLTTAKVAEFKKLGVKFVGRYVKSDSWKTLGSAEAKTITGYGLQILSVFERTADRTKGGAASGGADGREAYKHCQGLGQPTDSAIYFAVDYDAPPSQYDNIEAYLLAAKKEIGAYKIGVYGSFSVVEEMAKRIPGIYIWQTLAWSKGKISDKAHVYQRQIDTKVAGTNIDWNDMYAEAGLWGGTPIVNPAPGETKPIEELRKIDLILIPRPGSGVKSTSTGYLINNRSFVSLSDLSRVFGFTKGWDSRTKTARINGSPVSDGRLIGNEVYVRADVIAQSFKGTLSWDNSAKELTLLHGGA